MMSSTLHRMADVLSSTEDWGNINMNTPSHLGFVMASPELNFFTKPESDWDIGDPCLSD